MMQRGVTLEKMLFYLGEEYVLRRQLAEQVAALEAERDNSGKHDPDDNQGREVPAASGDRPTDRDGATPLSGDHSDAGSAPSTL